MQDFSNHKQIFIDQHIANLIQAHSQWNIYSAIYLVKTSLK